jgi:trans-aconitate 2-methyltransferase
MQKKAWEFDGKKYRKASSLQKVWGRKLFDGQTIRGNEKILDLGCGDGTMTIEFAEFVPQGSVLGIDASEGMIKEAQILETQNCEFKLLDIDDIDFIDEFDIIVSNATLHWVKNHDKLIRNCYRSLKKGGFFRVNFAGDGNCEYLISVLRELISHEKFRSDFEDFEWPWYMPEKDEYALKIQQSDFKNVQISGWPYDKYFEDLERLVAWIDQPGIVPFMQHLRDKKIKNEFRSDVIYGIKKLSKQSDNRYLERFQRIDVFATK